MLHFKKKREKKQVKRSFGEVMGQSLLLFLHRSNEVGDDLIAGWNVRHWLRIWLWDQAWTHLLLPPLTAEPSGKVFNLD